MGPFPRGPRFLNFLVMTKSTITGTLDEAAEKIALFEDVGEFDTFLKETISLIMERSGADVAAVFIPPVSNEGVSFGGVKALYR